MKRIILFAVAMILVISSSFSQENSGVNSNFYYQNSNNAIFSFYKNPSKTQEQNSFSLNKRRRSGTTFFIGGKLGMNVTSFWGASKTDDMNSKIGLNIGFAAGLEFGEIFSLQAGLNFEQKGCIVKSDSISDDSDISLETKTKNRYNYLTIPILFRASFGKTTKVYIETGPYIGILISARQKGTTILTLTDTMIVTDINENQGDVSSTIDFGWSIGSGVFFPLNNRPRKANPGIFAGIRYNMGYISTSKAYNMTVGGTSIKFPSSDLKNSAFEINIGFRLPIN